MSTPGVCPGLCTWHPLRLALTLSLGGEDGEGKPQLGDGSFTTYLLTPPPSNLSIPPCPVCPCVHPSSHLTDHLPIRLSIHEPCTRHRFGAWDTETDIFGLPLVLHASCWVTITLCTCLSALGILVHGLSYSHLSRNGCCLKETTGWPGPEGRPLLSLPGSPPLNPALSEQG